MARRPRVGEQITRLIRSLVAVKDWDKGYTMAYVAERTHYSVDTVYHWQQGRSCPSSETSEILAWIGKEQANLSREWGESLLKGTNHPDTTTVVNKLWGPKEIRSIPCNLPPPGYTELIGRQAEIAHLLELLSPRYAAHLISVDGIGGVGKTALVLEVAYRCWRTSTGEVPNHKVSIFDAIIFVSAKQQYLTPDGILPRYKDQRTLRDIFREVAYTLNRFEITHTTPEDQPSRVREALTRQQTLLIVDNLETMEDKQEILSFLYELPPLVKVVITTRERALFSPIRLEELADEAALNLIEKEAQEKEVDVSKEQILTLYRRIGGIPAALVYAIGQVASGYSVETVLDRLPQATGDVARFCFEGSVGPLRGQKAHYLLMAMAMFPEQPLRATIAYTAGLASDPIAVEEGLAQLQRLSLVSQRQQEGRYRMLPLTREYALAELAAHQEFEQEARRRWVEWYLDFTKEYGGEEWTEWHLQYDQLEKEWENLLAVFDWCAAHEQYDEIRAFWQPRGVLNVAYIYGYWDDRLNWLSWLIKTAERRGDWSTAGELMMEKGYTLSVMGRLEEADEILRRAWNLHDHTTPRVQVKLAQNIAHLRIYQRQYEDAFSWLDQAKVLLGAAHLDEREYIRRQLDTQSYYGWLYYEIQNYRQAEMHFREVLEHAQTIGWQRAVIYAQNWLANIAITQGKLDEAETLLQMGLTVSERNKDKRRVAFSKHAFALLYKKRGNLDKSHRWAVDALDDFERLGMQREADKVKELLQELQD